MLNINKEDFVNYYEYHSVSEIIEFFKISHSSVYNLVLRYGLPTKTDIKFAIQLTERQQEIIVGSLLGDGCLTTPRRKTYNSQFQEGHGTPQKEYCYWKFQELLPFSKKFFQTKKTPCELIINGTDNFTLRTICHPTFTELEYKWYKRDQNNNYVLKDNKKIKIVPQDLLLTPFSLAIWFMDDGCNMSAKRSAELCVNCFTAKEIEFLISKIKTLGITNCHANFPKIYIGTSSYLGFIDLIKPYIPHPCMEYKISLEKYPEYKFNVSSEETKQLIMALFDNGLNLDEIAKEINYPKLYIYNVLRKRWKIKNFRNRSGVVGVSWNKDKKKWSAHMGKKHLGYYKTKEEAVMVRQSKEKLKDAS
jgi:predicted DNA-binding protein YlxM (UPF0122 family)